MAPGIITDSDSDESNTSSENLSDSEKSHNSQESGKIHRKIGHGGRVKEHRQPAKPRVKSSAAGETEADGKSTSVCPDFGVRSYIHYFYERGVKDPTIYDDLDEDDHRYLLQPHGGRRHRGRFRSCWWKLSMFIGGNILLLGLIASLVGYLVPRKAILLKSSTDIDKVKELLDTDAIFYNHALDLVKLLGLVSFSVGGALFILSLLVPLLCESRCTEFNDESFRVQINGSSTSDICPKSPTVPATEILSNVQPVRKQPDAIVTDGGTVRRYSEIN